MSRPEAGMVSKRIPGLTTFKTVTMTAVTKAQTEKKANGSMHYYWSPPILLRARNRAVYSRFRQEWEGTLGPAKWYDGHKQELRYLEFRPRDHWASVPAGLT